MAKTREIRKRIKAVKNIQRITKTMQMIATAKFKTALDRATATKPYSEKVRELVSEVAAGARGIENPLFRSPDPATGRELLLVLTSDRGLCGAYNSNVLKAAMGYLQESEADVRLETVGKKGVNFFKFAGRPVSEHHAQFGDQPTYEDVAALAERYMKEFAEGAYDRINVAYMQFISTGRQRAVVEPLLPLSRPAESEGDGGAGAAKAGVEYEFSPSAESLLGELLPITVKTQLFQMFNDATVSEHVFRMVAMKAATDNAQKFGKQLQRTFNRARQAQITTEISEIIGGAASLE